MTNQEYSQDKLERRIAHQGLASRREAKEMIKQGLVKVNNTVVKEPSFLVSENDQIEIEQSQSTVKETYIVHKPRGIETSKTNESSRDIHDIFPKLSHLSPVGRLDKDSEGLILLTNDGVLSRILTQPDSKIGKTYKVTVRENISNDSITKLSNGIVLDGVKTKKAEVERISRNTFRIVLHEGRKHQIRRMCDACHLTIETLERIKIGDIEKGKMKAGDARELSETEIQRLKN